MQDEIIKYCYVCGFEFRKSKYFDSLRYPFYDCPCCFFEYGIEEFEFNVYINKRQEWINDGAEFAVLECLPYTDGWTLENAILQLQNLKDITINDPHFSKLNPDYNGHFNIKFLASKWKQS